MSERVSFTWHKQLQVNANRASCVLPINRAARCKSGEVIGIGVVAAYVLRSNRDFDDRRRSTKYGYRVADRLAESCSLQSSRERAPALMKSNYSSVVR